MEIVPTVDALHWVAEAGQDILADEKIPSPQPFFKPSARPSPTSRSAWSA
jgi:hypothetical protein